MEEALARLDSGTGVGNHQVGESTRATPGLVAKKVDTSGRLDWLNDPSGVTTCYNAPTERFQILGVIPGTVVACYVHDKLAYIEWGANTPLDFADRLATLYGLPRGCQAGTLDLYVPRDATREWLEYACIDRCPLRGSYGFLLGGGHRTGALDGRSFSSLRIDAPNYELQYSFQSQAASDGATAFPAGDPSVLDYAGQLYWTATPLERLATDEFQKNRETYLRAAAARAADALGGVRLGSAFNASLWQRSADGSWVRPASVAGVDGIVSPLLCGATVRQVSFFAFYSNASPIDEAIVRQVSDPVRTSDAVHTQMVRALFEAGYTLESRDFTSTNPNAELWVRDKDGGRSWRSLNNAGDCTTSAAGTTLCTVQLAAVNPTLPTCTEGL